MPAPDETRMPLSSQDARIERLAALRELFPKAFAEGVLDADKLRACCKGSTGMAKESL